MKRLLYSSYKYRRVVGFVLDGKIYNFADCFNVVFSLRVNIGKLIGKKLSFTILTDAEILLNTLVKFITTSTAPNDRHS